MSARSETLREALTASPHLATRRIWGAQADVGLHDLARSTALGGALAGLAGCSVLLRVSDPLYAALALVDLDGVARRIVLCPPDLAEADLPTVAQIAEIDAVVSDGPSPLAGVPVATVALPIRPVNGTPIADLATEWVMFTSGTSGTPKMVVHSLAGLVGAIRREPADPVIWGTFYDIRRYGGLQILLRALLTNASLVITGPGESFDDFLPRIIARGVTHLTGTPSHWRRLLMTPEAKPLAPRYVRLSGEIADQAVLDALSARFAGVPVGHAYASTEAGVGFEVNDGREGFPADFVGRDGPVLMKVEDGSLRLRTERAATHYLNADAGPLRDADGFVDSGDMLELRDGRYYFVGRRNGVINVGGLKVHPEEVEAVINRHPAVRMSLVKARRNPITGAIVIAEVVLNPHDQPDDALKAEILALCRRELPPFKVPAALRIVPEIAITASGKLERAIA